MNSPHAVAEDIELKTQNSKLKTLGDRWRTAAPWMALTALIGYQAVMYGAVMRISLHVSNVLIPWLLRQPGYRLYDNVYLGYTPAHLWGQALLDGLVPDPLLRIRAGMILVAALTTGLVYWLAKRRWGMPAGIAAAVLYGLWQPVLGDYPLYFEIVLGVLALSAMAVWRERDSSWWRPVLAGAVVGLAFLVKQQGIALAGVFVVWRLWGTNRADGRRALVDLARFAAGIILPVLAVSLILAQQGLLTEALFLWTGQFAPYLETSWQFPPLGDWLILAVWLSLVPLYLFHSLPHRERWREAILLIGLLAVLCLPAVPRYGRFHLSGAVPMAALVGAAALYYTFQNPHEPEKERAALRKLIRGYAIGAAALLIVAGLALPTYYRLKLGPLIGEYEGLEAIGGWLAAETDATPGTRVWMLPEIDATGNFYPVSGYLPPRFWAQMHPWIYAVPGLMERSLDGLEADPPSYAVLIEQWRNQVPAALDAYLNAHYTPIGGMDAPHGLGRVSIYRRNS